MLNIFKNKQKLKNESLNINKEKTQVSSIRDENKNIIYYPSSTKEWFSSVYSYNKSYTKSLISYDFILNNLFWGYCNMLLYKIKILFKRRRHNKSRYSANKIYLSRAELKHTNTKLLIILYTYNKQKSSLERYIRKIITITKSYRVLIEDQTKYMISDRYKKIKVLKNNNYKLGFSKKIFGEDSKIKFVVSYRNRVIRLFKNLLKNNVFVLKKWNMAFFKVNNYLSNYLVLNIKRNKLYKIPRYNIRLLKKLIKLQKIIFNNIKSIHFNKSKFSNLVLNLKGLGLINLIQKIYGKKIEIKLVELKSIHLNSDVFSSAVALKLRDRQNKAVRVLRKAILQMVKIPDLHTLITFDDNVEIMNKNNIVNTVKQQAVSGVRFEASGRLTRRLTAMRAVFKYRYVGSLKDLRSSFNSKSSTMLRGYVKSNSQYTIINTKTRNGSFGLKGWVSSH